MLHHTSQGVHWLQFKLFAKFPTLIHGVFLRKGGFSEGAYASLNFSYDHGDNPIHVNKNREKVRKILGIDKLVSIEQRHGCHMVHVSKEEDSSCFGDALITQQKGIGLVIQHADCQVAIIFDPIREVIANVHAGWKGSAQNIYAKVIQELKEKYGSHPQDLLIAISPSLGPEKAEFIHYQKELPNSFWNFKNESNYFDFWKISLWQLTNSGVRPENIEIAQMCTYKNVEECFSYRRDKITGRHGTIVAL